MVPLANNMPYDSIPSYLLPLVGFRTRKAAQICAYLALKSDGIIEKLKLIKLVYLSERAFLGNYRTPMLFDELYSLPHGPICSSTLNGINGAVDEEVWSDYIARNGNLVVALKKFDRDSLDEVSDVEIECLDEIWARLGQMTSSQLRNFSHKNCAEYTEIETGRIPITYGEVMSALGDERPEVVEEEIQELRRAESVFS
jgi:uncharacterized phage-associated protein